VKYDHITLLDRLNPNLLFPTSASSETEKKGESTKKHQIFVQFQQKISMIFSECFFDTSCGFPQWGIK
jgi:hypothetical protein